MLISVTFLCHLYFPDNVKVKDKILPTYCHIECDVTTQLQISLKAENLFLGLVP